MPGFTLFSQAMTSEGMKYLIRDFEGCRLTAYRCPANVLTIGYGHTGRDVKPGLLISKQKAIELLKNDAQRFVNYVNSTTCTLILNRERDAYTSLTFNCGYILKGELLTSIQANAKQLTRAKILGYCHAHVNGQLTILRGLQRRRQAECKWHEFGKL